MFMGGVDRGAEACSPSSGKGHPRVLLELEQDSEVVFRLEVMGTTPTSRTSSTYVC